jgi:hypothetical protein
MLSSIGLGTTEDISNDVVFIILVEGAIDKVSESPECKGKSSRFVLVREVLVGRVLILRFLVAAISSISVLLSEVSGAGSITRFIGQQSSSVGRDFTSFYLF